MLTLKLQRIGKKHQASFRLIVGEKREKLNGKQLEDLGWYDPRADKMNINKDRAQYWLKQGAQKTDTVHNLLIKAGVIEGKKIAVHKQPRRTKDDKKEVGAPTSASEPKTETATAPAADVSVEASPKAEAAVPAEQK